MPCSLFDAGLIATPNCATVADGKVRLCPGSEELQARRLEQLWLYVKNAGMLHTIHVDVICQMLCQYKGNGCAMYSSVFSHFVLSNSDK